MKESNDLISIFDIDKIQLLSWYNIAIILILFNVFSCNPKTSDSKINLEKEIEILKQHNKTKEEILKQIQIVEISMQKVSELRHSKNKQTIGVLIDAFKLNNDKIEKDSTLTTEQKKAEKIINNEMIARMLALITTLGDISKRGS